MERFLVVFLKVRSCAKHLTRIGQDGYLGFVIVVEEFESIAQFGPHSRIDRIARFRAIERDDECTLVLLDAKVFECWHLFHMVPRLFEAVSFVVHK